MSETLQTRFGNCTLDTLKQYGNAILSRAKNHDDSSMDLKSVAGPKLKMPLRKADLIAWIKSYLANSQFIQSLYEELDEIGVAAISEAVHSGNGHLNLMRFGAKYGKIPVLSWGWYGRSAGRNIFPLMALFMESNGSMPREIVEILKPLVPLPKPLRAVYTDSLTQALDYDPELIVLHVTEKAALNDVLSILMSIDSGKVGVGAKTSKPSKTGAKALREVLSHGDFYPDDLESDTSWDVQMGPSGIRPFAWALLTQASKMAQINGNKLALGRNGKAALKKPAHVVLKQIWDRWLTNKSFHEFNRIEMIKGQKSKSRPLASPLPAREEIANTLAQLKEGEWIQWGHFKDYLIALGFNFEIARNPWGLYIGDANYGNLSDQGSWDHLEGRFARAFLLEYAATLGIIDVALVPPWESNADIGGLWGGSDLSCLSRYDGLLALRLNSLGAYILGNADEYEPMFHEEPSLQVLANRDITFIGTEGLSDRMFLDKVAEKSSDRVWRISLPKLLEAAEGGTPVSEVLEFLENRCRHEIPQPVLAFFEDVHDRTNQVRDGGGARLISCIDPTVAILIANDTKLRKLCLPAGDRHLAVPLEKINQFHKELKRLGYAVSARCNSE